MQSENTRNLFKVEASNLLASQQAKHFPTYENAGNVEITSNFQQDATRITCWYTNISSSLSVTSSSEDGADDIVNYDIPAGVGDIYSDFVFAINLPAVKVKDSFKDNIRIKWSKMVTQCVIKEVKLMIGDNSEITYDGISQIIETGYNSLPQFEDVVKSSVGMNVKSDTYSTKISGHRIVYKLPGLNNRGDTEFEGLSRFRIPDKLKVSLRVTYNLALTSLIHTVTKDEDMNDWTPTETNLSLLMCNRPKITRPILSSSIKQISTEERKNLLCFKQGYTLLYNYLENVTKTEVRVKLGEIARIELQIPSEAEVKALFVVATDDRSPDTYALGHDTTEIGVGVVDCIASAKLEIKAGKNFVVKQEFGPNEAIIESSHYVRLPFVKGIRSLPLCLRPFSEDVGVPLGRHEIRLTVQLGDYRDSRRQVEEPGKKTLDNWMWGDEHANNLYQIRIYALYERKTLIEEVEVVDE